MKNNSLIPSRNERRVSGIKWSIAWRNFHALRKISAEEFEFVWKIQQDMLPVGARIHRRNAEKRCMMQIQTSGQCEALQTREHFFQECEGVQEVFGLIKDIIEMLLEKKVQGCKLLHFDITHRDKKKLKCALWFGVKALYKVYQDRIRNKLQLLIELQKEVEWNLKVNRQVGSFIDFMKLKSIIGFKIIGLNMIN